MGEKEKVNYSIFSLEGSMEEYNVYKKKLHVSEKDMIAIMFTNCSKSEIFNQ